MGGRVDKDANNCCDEQLVVMVTINEHCQGGKVGQSGCRPFWLKASAHPQF